MTVPANGTDRRCPDREVVAGTQPLSSGLKLMRLLDVLAHQDEPLRLADIAKLAGDHRAAVHRQLVTLVAAGWLDHLGNRRYRLSTKAVALGSAALQQSDGSERIRDALQLLANEAGFTAALATVDGDLVRIHQRVEPARRMRVSIPFGHTFPLLGSASGMVFLAHDQALLAALPDPVTSHPTPDELAEVRTHGHAVDTFNDGVDALRAIAIPVPANGATCAAALSLVGTESALAPSDELLAAMRGCAASLAVLLEAHETLGQRS